MLAIAHHERILEIAAAEVGHYLVHTPEGAMRIKAIIRDDIAEACGCGDRTRELAPKLLRRSTQAMAVPNAPPPTMPMRDMRASCRRAGRLA